MDEGLLRLDDDVAELLHEIAGQSFDGDVNLAMNECLRAILKAEKVPEDAWAAIGIRARAKAARRTPPGSQSHGGT